MFQVINPPYKKVTLACIACLCFEIGVCPWPDLSALFQYTSPTPVVLLHLIPRIQYHPGIPVTLLTGSSFIFICCYCNWRHAFVPKRARFIRFCMHNFITVGHNFNQFIAQQRLFLLRLLFLGYIFLVLFSRYDFNFVVCHL